LRPTRRSCRPPLPTRLRFKEVPVHQLPRSEATIATVPSVAAGHDQHFVAAVLERWRGATSHRDVPNDPSISDRPAARIMTPVEVKMNPPLRGEADRQALVEALELAEWGAGPAAGQRLCPVCVRGGERDGHEPGCKLSAALAAAKGETV